MKLQVIVLTYNHQIFIERALRGVQNQKVDFELEVLIADDCSTDETVKIVEEFKKSNSVKIQLFKNESNKGILHNVKFLLQKVTAPYIAILDGDDFWNYSNKLQSQVDFLDSNSEFNGSFHDAAIIHKEMAVEKKLFKGAKTYSQLYKYNEEVHLADMIKRLIIPTSSLVSRVGFINENNLALLENNYSIAWKLTCLSINKSKFYYFNETWSTYVNHLSGFSKKDNLKFHEHHISFLNAIKDKADFKYNKREIYSTLASEQLVIIEREKAPTLRKILGLITYTRYAIISWFYGIKLHIVNH